MSLGWGRVMSMTMVCMMCMSMSMSVGWTHGARSQLRRKFLISLVHPQLSVAHRIAIH